VVGYNPTVGRDEILSCPGHWKSIFSLQFYAVGLYLNQTACSYGEERLTDLTKGAIKLAVKNVVGQGNTRQQKEFPNIKMWKILSII